MSARHDALLWSPAYLSAKLFFFGSVSIFMHSRCRHDANEIPLRTRRAWAFSVAVFKPPAGRTSFSSFRFAQFIAEAIHILRHLAPPTHTHTRSVYLARDQRLTTAHSCVFHFQARVLFFLLRPIGKRFPRTGLDHKFQVPTPIRPPRASTATRDCVPVLCPSITPDPVTRPNPSKASTPQVLVPCGRISYQLALATPQKKRPPCASLCCSLKPPPATPPKAAPSAVSPGPLAR
ncbi:hypothetical protein V8C44DRAFT_333464 [Trichoderma aethiopicum]